MKLGGGFFLLLALAQIGQVWAGDLPAAVDLAAESRQSAQAGWPLLVLYSRRDCSYCETVRREHLRHLNTDPRYQGLVVRQINQDSSAPLRDFANRATTHAAQAAREKIRLVPVVAFYGPAGQTLAAPIVGARIADFYDGDLANALNQAAQALKAR